ncbi:hypothetical protein [Paenibacillus sp. MMS18-CY102]|uniref:hypothetical protein n=1 Tax=Paenibacillus sp. MMS18-CY102 TaxID=2682849 RepID=UPI00136548E5|nr:hypothetical protein [Paenibacillus sp. MMS18-CY102]MWC28456.1 hypothetical protein [Paenibacillus sp. MMS18-CY102]
MRRIILAVTLLVIMVSVTGCMYPKDRLVENQMPAKDAILNTQTVVNQYYKDTGLLPMLTADVSVPKYEKYRLDFDKLKSKRYISDMPASSFEGGGQYYYLIINEETTRDIKLMDIAVVQQVMDLQRQVDTYYDSDAKMVSLNAEEAYHGYHRIDFKLLGIKDPKIVSMYSGRAISPMIDDRGLVYLDYGLDIAQAIQKSGKMPKADSDLREVLVASSDLVPVKSPVYKWVNGEPQAQPWSNEQ